MKAYLARNSLLWFITLFVFLAVILSAALVDSIVRGLFGFRVEEYSGVGFVGQFFITALFGLVLSSKFTTTTEQQLRKDLLGFSHSRNRLILLVLTTVIGGLASGAATKNLQGRTTDFTAAFLIVTMLYVFVDTFVFLKGMPSRNILRTIVAHLAAYAGRLLLLFLSLAVFALIIFLSGGAHFA